MNDCMNSEIRDLLPDLLHGSILNEDRIRVEAHLHSCPDCKAEFELLSSVLAAYPQGSVDASRITSAVRPYRRRRIFAAPPLVRIAASIAIVALGGVSYSIVSRGGVNGGIGGYETAVAVIGGDSTSPARANTVTPLAISSELDELDNESLAALIAQLEAMEVAMPVEPRSVVPSINTSGDLE